jgi:3-deoxy-manno-octulosonate cytidylyltransferase (CMP-KDO synthetase)
LSTPCSPQEMDDPNAVKVVTASDGRALYFSRATIPYNRGLALAPRKHLGIYAYRKAALRRFASLRPSPLELAERLEQLRLLENGINVYVEHTTVATIGVDTEEDLLAAERLLQNQLP